MTFYIQYDEEGNITGTVMGDRTPVRERQLEFVDYFDTSNKRVNLQTLELEEIEQQEE